MEPYTAISSAGPGDMPAGAALILTLFSVAEGDALPCFKSLGQKTEVNSQGLASESDLCTVILTYRETFCDFYMSYVPDPDVGPTLRMTLFKDVENRC